MAHLYVYVSLDFRLGDCGFRILLFTAHAFSVTNPKLTFTLPFGGTSASVDVK